MLACVAVGYVDGTWVRVRAEVYVGGTRLKTGLNARVAGEGMWVGVSAWFASVAE